MQEPGPESRLNLLRDPAWALPTPPHARKKLQYLGSRAFPAYLQTKALNVLSSNA